jgi:hypothetical protein
VDHGGLHSDIGEVPVQKERPSLYNVSRRSSGELLKESQTGSRNPALSSRMDSEIVLIVFLNI